MSLLSCTKFILIMKSFKNLIYTFSLFSLLLLAYRLIKSDSLSYIFLVWNLFLAFIPWWISNFINKQSSINYRYVPIIVLWFLFLPNAPYILTDLFHLKERTPFPLWYDLVLVLSFALCGLLLFFKSLKDMFELLHLKLKPLYVTLITPFVFWLISFGLYLGRYLRFNSWDIIHPFHILKSSYTILFQKDTIGFTCVFSIFLWFIYVLLIQFNKYEKV